MKKDFLGKRGFAFVVSFVLTILLLRLFLYFSPFVNLNFGRYNVHHLFLGALLLVIVFILLMMNISALVVFIIGGIASGSVVDEWVYLIFTDGSDLSYLTSVSLWGAMGLGLLLLIFLAILYFYQKNKVR